MNRFVFLVLFLLTPMAWSMSVMDDLGHSIVLPKPAQRIVSLAPDITEIFFDVGAGDKVIAVVSGCDYPSAAKRKLTVGSYAGLDLERIVSLHPDLIVVWGNNFARQITILEKLGIPIYHSQPRRLEDVARTMQHLGELVGMADKANQRASYYLNNLDHLKQKYHFSKPINVFYQIGAYSLYTINKDSWINQAIELCGGQNVFANAMSIAPQVDFEAVVVAKPEVIISDTKTASWQKRWQAFPSVPAVKLQQFCTITTDWIDRAGPRLWLGVDKMCECINKARHVD